MKNQKIIYFDGVCNLCNWAVRFVIDHDRKGTFYFSSLQSEFARKHLLETNGQHINCNSVIYQFGDQILAKSDAVFEVLKEIGGIWKLLIVFSIFPRSLMDRVYDFVADHRYSWFGKRNQCMIPPPAWQSRFLE